MENEKKTIIAKKEIDGTLYLLSREIKELEPIMWRFEIENNPFKLEFIPEPFSHYCMVVAAMDDEPEVFEQMAEEGLFTFE